jgi:hypothetical protein
MPISEHARNAVRELAIFADAKPGVWYPETITRDLVHWREGLARNLSDVLGCSIHEAYREIPADLDGLLGWCSDIAGDPRKVA